MCIRDRHTNTTVWLLKNYSKRILTYYTRILLLDLTCGRTMVSNSHFFRLPPWFCTRIVIRDSAYAYPKRDIPRRGGVPQTETQFTRYNHLWNRLNNRLDNQLYRVHKHSTGCPTGCSTGCMNSTCLIRATQIQPFTSCKHIQPVVQPVSQPVVSCKRGLRSPVIKLSTVERCWRHYAYCIAPPERRRPHVSSRRMYTYFRRHGIAAHWAKIANFA